MCNMAYVKYSRYGKFGKELTCSLVNIGCVGDKTKNKIQMSRKHALKATSTAYAYGITLPSSILKLRLVGVPHASNCRLKNSYGTGLLARPVYESVFSRVSARGPIITKGV